MCKCMCVTVCAWSRGATLWYVYEKQLISFIVSGSRALYSAYACICGALWGTIMAGDVEYIKCTYALTHSKLH